MFGETPAVQMMSGRQGIAARWQFLVPAAGFRQCRRWQWHAFCKISLQILDKETRRIPRYWRAPG